MKLANMGSNADVSLINDSQISLVAICGEILPLIEISLSREMVFEISSKNDSILGPYSMNWSYFRCTIDPRHSSIMW